MLSQGQACYAPLNDIYREWGRVDIRYTIYDIRKRGGSICPE